MNYNTLANEEINKFNQRYLEKPYTSEQGKTFTNFLAFFNEKFFYNCFTEEFLKSNLTIENVSKALELKAFVESLPYEKVHYVIETMSLIEINAEYVSCNIRKPKIEGYLGYIIAASGNVEAAKRKLVGHVDDFNSYANDIASTAF